MTWAEKIIAYNRALRFDHKLPNGIKIMNPYEESGDALSASESFYKKFYSDNKPRKLIMGINPGRHGAGSTGIPFTDPKRLRQVIKLDWSGNLSHEPSSVFVYEMIHAFGGPKEFYSKYFINSVSPLGYTIRNTAGKEVNYNYYDSADLFNCVMPFILSNLEQLKQMEFDMSKVFCLGVKNAECLKKITRNSNYFKELIVLEHPRYIMQYHLKSKETFIDKYVNSLK